MGGYRNQRQAGEEDVKITMKVMRRRMRRKGRRERLFLFF